MRRSRLVQLLDVERIEQVLRAAEQRTSGEIRVSFAPLFWGRLQTNAARAFKRLGMNATRERNGVLFFVVPSRRRLVVMGDEGIHQRVGQPFWELVAVQVSRSFRAGDFTGGLERGIGAVAQKLAEHFPPRADDLNELPDALDFGAPDPSR